MTGGVEPLRAEFLPGVQLIRACRALAGARAFVSLAARPIVLSCGAFEIRAEADAVIGKGHRPIRVAISRCDGIAEARDQEVAPRELGGIVQRCVVAAA